MWFGEEFDAHDVVILGAGFSRAASRHFPLMDELGVDALDEAEVAEDERPQEGKGFEAWLSRISDDQPYRTAEENLTARQLFLRVSTAIANIMRDKQRLALGVEPPSWLEDLISVLHTRQATILSFDYDNVVEWLVDGHCLSDWSSGGMRMRVTSDDVIDHLPPLPPSLSDRYRGGQVARSLRLLKLHGSLSWYWSPDDVTGVTLQR